MTVTTWDEVDKDVAITLSSGNLTATASSVARETGVRAADSQTTGRFYYEVTINGVGGNTNIGLVSQGGTWYAMNAIDLLGVFVYPAFNIYFNGSDTGVSLGGLIATDVVRCAISLTNSRVWFAKNNGNWNNSGTADPATNVGGISISSLTGHPWVPYFGAGASTTAGCTANFGDSSFIYTVPSGFTSGWTANTGAAATSFNPNDTESGLTLSHSNYTVAAASPGTDALTRSLNSITSGQYYQEFYWVEPSGGVRGVSAVGFANSSAVGPTLGSSGTNGTIVYDGGSVFVQGVRQGAASLLGTIGAGNIISVAIDMAANLVWFRRGAGNWNGDGSADPAAGLGGFSLSTLSGSLFLVALSASGNTINTIGIPEVISRSKMTPPSGFALGISLGSVLPAVNLQAAVNMM